MRVRVLAAWMRAAFRVVRLSFGGYGPWAGLVGVGFAAGAGALVLLMAVSAGGTSSALARRLGIGPDLLTVTVSDPVGAVGGPSSPTAAAVPGVPGLTAADAGLLARSPLDPDVAEVAPVVSVPGIAATVAGVAAGGASIAVSAVVGSTPAYPVMAGDSLAAGADFTAGEYNDGQRVVLLGHTLAVDLFGGAADAVGHTVDLGDTPFAVVGVLAAKGVASASYDPGGSAIAPLTAVQGSLAASGPLSSIEVLAVGADRTAAARAEVISLLREERHATGADPGFAVTQTAALVAPTGLDTGPAALAFAVVCLLSFAAGVVILVAVMVASIAARVREIGVRKAFGARPAAIRRRFLGEALLMSSVGGLVGVACGSVGSLGIIDGVEPVLSPYSLLLALILSALLGVAAASLPAARAARIPAIEALRHE